jgi:hypothetical protein
MRLFRLCPLTSDFYGGHSKEDPPVPIPNTEVKLFSADGTARATVWESRSPPFFARQSPGQVLPARGFVVSDWPQSSAWPVWWSRGYPFRGCPGPGRPQSSCRGRVCRVRWNGWLRPRRFWLRIMAQRLVVCCNRGLLYPKVRAMSTG